MHPTFLRNIVFIAISIFCLTNTTNAQNRFADSLDVNVGLSFTDWYQLGVRYRFDQNQLGITAFLLPPVSGQRPLRYWVGLQYYRHLWGQSKYSHQKPWFIKPALTWSRESDTQGNFTNGYISEFTSRLYARIYLGREFNLSKRSGISLAVGPWTEALKQTRNNFRKEIEFFGFQYPGFDIFFYYRVHE